MSISSREPGEHLSHWYHLFPGLGVTPKQFYEELQRRIAGREFPQTQTGIIECSEAGLMSAKRAYLRVSRGDLVFDICGAPFGNDSFFVSYWLGRMRLGGCLSVVVAIGVMIPVVGAIIERGLSPMTYYQIDTALMFQQAIHEIVIGYVDELSTAQNIEPISEHERKPSMKRLTDL